MEQVGGTAMDRQGASALKFRRSKKGLTAAQLQGKVTGRWTDDEHKKFTEGKCRFKSLPGRRRLYRIITSNKLSLCCQFVVSE